MEPYTSLLTNGKLPSYLAEIDREALEQVNALTARLAASAGVTEALKASDPLAWTAQMNTFISMAEEMVLRETS